MLQDAVAPRALAAAKIERSPPRQRIDGRLVAPALDEDRRACTGVEGPLAGCLGGRRPRTRGAFSSRFLHDSA